MTTARRSQRFSRPSSCRRALSSLVAAALLLAGCTASRSTPTSKATATATEAALPDTPAGAQARWLVAATRRLPIPEAEMRAHINPSFLSLLTPAQLNQALQSVGPLTPVAIGASLPWMVGFEASTDSTQGAPPRVGVGIAVTSNGSIGDLSWSATPPSSAPAPPTTWDGVDAMLRSVAPQVRLLVADVTSGSCRPIHAIDPATAAPIASAFKLYVLAALATAVRSGRLSWDQQLTLTPRVKSLPSGVMQYEPDGTRVSVRDAAAHMIAISDNTATDLLISALGRPAVEAALTATGMADRGASVSGGEGEGCADSCEHRGGGGLGERARTVLGLGGDDVAAPAPGRGQVGRGDDGSAEPALEPRAPPRRAVQREAAVVGLEHVADRSEGRLPGRLREPHVGTADVLRGGEPPDPGHRGAGRQRLHGGEAGQRGRVDDWWRARAPAGLVGRGVPAGQGGPPRPVEKERLPGGQEGLVLRRGAGSARRCSAGSGSSPRRRSSHGFLRGLEDDHGRFSRPAPGVAVEVLLQ